uniref:Uncharacterized protein n=1 Tax=Chromera velia CCMP2878 TaxID=1169474 RepID=A0A0G4FTT4_9ALVE|eukprot:Cvel_18738.t1-p1 / transcript=Cvel_18738.t1 / gene=Cvel_18738 / organism=Chromera_velia_CCMP2878 / gene_product=hypothetical protein / transcript_product=hypothetical protein / location=Cvel_scaffold1571:25871-26086(+) / protein_length=72 / sequence_SO=supercontig / SO=protein_coding / is_pseudo=false
MDMHIRPTEALPNWGVEGSEPSKKTDMRWKSPWSLGLAVVLLYALIVESGESTVEAKLARLTAYGSMGVGLF